MSDANEPKQAPAVEAGARDERVSMIQTLMLDWINARAGKEALAVWNRIEEKLAALARESDTQKTLPAWVFDNLIATLQPAFDYVQTHQEQFGALAGDDKAKIIADEFLRHARASEAAQPVSDDKLGADITDEQIEAVWNAIDASDISALDPKLGMKLRRRFARALLSRQPCAGDKQEAAARDRARWFVRDFSRDAGLSMSDAQTEVMLNLFLRYAAPLDKCKPFECDVAQRYEDHCHDGECERAQIDGAPCWEDECDIVMRGSAAPSSASEAAKPADDDTRERIARALHYPACWDTAAYPTLDSASWEAIACAKLGCSTCDSASEAKDEGPKVLFAVTNTRGEITWATVEWDGVAVKLIRESEAAQPAAGDKQESNSSAYQRGYLDGMAKGKRDAAADEKDAAPSVAQGERGAFEYIERASYLERDDEGDYVNPCVQSAWEGFQQGCGHARAASTPANVAQGAEDVAENRVKEGASEAAAGEPVAWTSPERLKKIAERDKQVDTMWCVSLREEGDVPLYAAPQPTQAAAPAGWNAVCPEPGDTDTVSFDAAPQPASEQQGARCDLGVGCEEAGVCYAMANGQPDRCGAAGPSDKAVYQAIADNYAKDLKAEQQAARGLSDDDDCPSTPASERAAFNAMMRWHLIRLLQAWRYGGDMSAAALAAFEWARRNSVGKEAFKASERAVKLAAKGDGHAD